VVIAPGRAERPGAGWPQVGDPTAEELVNCPFCVGREDRTPPETLRVGDPWRVRVVPNLYPAFERQEVVVHTPEHVRSIAELDDPQLAFVAEAWQRRRHDEPAGYLHALINEGKSAGGSLAHSHSQLVWLPESPPTVATERELAPALEDNLVLDRDGVVAVVPRAGRVPYEALIAPSGPDSDPWSGERLATALQLLAELTRRLHTLGGRAIPLNAWLHAGPWWHLEVFPRLTVLAGIELGAGIYVNTLAPEEAAKQLRDTQK
jgi:UDPglucose--hexose-1-phosphate uridylyltransferase